MCIVQCVYIYPLPEHIIDTNYLYVLLICSDFGFSRDIASDECEVSPGIDPSNLDICINGVEEQITTWG